MRDVNQKRNQIGRWIEEHPEECCLYCSQTKHCKFGSDGNPPSCYHPSLNLDHFDLHRIRKERLEGSVILSASEAASRRQDWVQILVFRAKQHLNLGAGSITEDLVLRRLLGTFTMKLADPSFCNRDLSLARLYFQWQDLPEDACAEYDVFMELKEEIDDLGFLCQIFFEKAGYEAWIDQLDVTDLPHLVVRIPDHPEPKWPDVCI